jgi:hypothetical protein
MITQYYIKSNEGYPEIEATKQVGGEGREITSVRVAILSRLAYSQFPFVFAFKETSGRPDVQQR